MGDTKVKGDSTEVGCLLAFIRKGWKVSIPYGENCRYDMIVDRGNGDLIRVQCKSSKLLKNASFCISCTSNSKKYVEGEIDYFATTYKNKCYLIPFESKRVITFRLVPPKNNQKKFIKFAEDYCIGNIVQFN